MSRRTPFARRLTAAAGAALVAGIALVPAATAQTPNRPGVRFATYNASLARFAEGELVENLGRPAGTDRGPTQARVVAEIMQRVRPDVLLINEFDYDYRQGQDPTQAARLFRDNFLKVSQNGAPPLDLPFFFVAPTNTGVPSGMDFDNNGSVGGGGDAFGFGNYPGQFGMVVYSRFPIDGAQVRTFQNFLWRDMPGNRLPDDSSTAAPQDFYSDAEKAIFRLSSKTHWDIPVNVNGEIVHFLTSHPTPPVFDGPEDRNGTRNADEIRLFDDFITGGATANYLVDDQGRRGGLAPGSNFVVAGDQNSDPNDGDSIKPAIQALLADPLVNTSQTPDSSGGPDASASQGGRNTSHTGNPAFDTADFDDRTDRPAPGNLRADYVLPSSTLSLLEAAVFWPARNEPFANLTGTFNGDPFFAPGNGFPSSDHRLVFVDLGGLPTVAPVIPEVPLPLLLPLSAAALGGVALAVIRRRSAHTAAA